jgi:hypothetical protein
MRATMTTPPVVSPTRFIKWGGYMVCTVCKMAEAFCGCDKAKPATPPTGDGETSTLEARRRAVKGAQ